MILRLLQKHGHRPIVLLGGGTTLIGILPEKFQREKFLNKVKLKKILLISKKFLLNF